MISNTLIIIASNLPWEWSTDYVNETAVILSKKNLVICFLWKEGTSLWNYIFKRNRMVFLNKYQKNLYLFIPLHVLPFRRYPLVNRLNMRINMIIVRALSISFTKGRNIKRKILWIFDPIFGEIQRIIGEDFVSLYDCVDYISESISDPELKKEYKKQETYLLRHSSVVVVNSRLLYSIYKRLRSDVKIVPQGFRLSVFVQPSTNLLELPSDKPIIGYIGGLNDRLNFSLIEQIVRRCSIYNFVFVGPVQENMRTKSVSKFIEYMSHQNNFFYYPEQQKKCMRSIIQQFRIGIIPYDTSNLFNRYCYPAKLFEYFYGGLPVISTPIEELKRFQKYVRIGSTVEEWERNINVMLSRPWLKRHKEAQRRLARESSWRRKVEAISRAMGGLGV